MRRIIQRPGFTLVELLVVIAIIGSLIGVLLPAIGMVRAAARRNQCANNLHQLAVATLSYESTTGRFPPGLQQSVFGTGPVFRGMTLFFYLLPHIGEKPLAEQWVTIDPLVNSQRGITARTATVLPLLVCPSDVIPDNPTIQSRWTYALTSYGGNGGTVCYQPTVATLDGVFHTTGPASLPNPNQRAIRSADITDGATKTLLLGERSHVDRNYATFTAIGWGDPLETWGWWAASGGQKCIGHVTMESQVPVNFRIPFAYAGGNSPDPRGASQQTFQALADQRVTAWGSEHSGGANFAFAGGAVQFLTDDLSLDVLQALSTRAGGERLTDW